MLISCAIIDLANLFGLLNWSSAELPEVGLDAREYESLFRMTSSGGSSIPSAPEDFIQPDITGP
jgi:hypothetical protein